MGTKRKKNTNSLNRLVIFFGKSKKVALVIIAIITVLGGLITNIEKIKGLLPANTKAKQNTKNGTSAQPFPPINKATSSESNQSKEYPILNVTFNDGYEARIRFTVTTSVKPENAPFTVQQFGGRREAEDLLLPIVKSVILSTLEVIKLSEARANRNSLQKIIYEELQVKFNLYGITLENFLFLEFTTINKGK